MSCREGPKRIHEAQEDLVKLAPSLTQLSSPPLSKNNTVLAPCPTTRTGSPCLCQAVAAFNINDLSSHLHQDLKPRVTGPKQLRQTGIIPEIKLAPTFLSNDTPSIQNKMRDVKLFQPYSSSPLFASSFWAICLSRPPKPAMSPMVTP